MTHRPPSLTSFLMPDEPQAPAVTAAVRGPRPALSRRHFLRLASTATIGAGLAACARSPISAVRKPTAGRKAQLVYQDSSAAWFSPMARQMLDEFQETHPNIRVFYSPEPQNQADIEKVTLAEMENRTAADVIQGCCTWFPIWAQKGQLLDLRTYVAADLDKATIADWNQAQYRALFTKDGRQFGLPKYCGALALYYNKDLFDQYGVSYPESAWTYDDYARAMKQLTRDTNHDGQTDLWGSMMWMSWIRYQVHLNGWGGHIMDPDDDTQCRLDEAPALAALEWLRARTWDDQVMATKIRVNNMAPSAAFAGGRIAMAEDGSWALNDILSQAKFRIGVAAFPTAPVRKVTSATIDGFGIYAGTKDPDAAWELMKFLTGKDYGRAMAREGLLQPARISLIDDWANAIREKYPEQTKDVDIAAFAEGHIKGYAVTPEPAANMTEASRIVNEVMEKFLTYGDGSTDLIKAAAQQIDQTQQGTS
jgi:multiple sugar transport system substrate-binding protein